MKKVCHFTSVHSGLDTRIFYKECLSLVTKGYEVHLVISATNEERTIAAQSGVVMHQVPKEGGRASRIFLKTNKVYKIAKAIDADIYHFHDPELIFYGIILYLQGKKVIYDVHEDVPNDIMDKEWIPRWMRKIAATLFKAIEKFSTKNFLYTVAATKFIQKRFLSHNNLTEVINNYPRPEELINASYCNDRSEKKICYIGGISRIRGVKEVIQALSYVPDVTLVLCGAFSSSAFYEEVKALPGWSQVNYLGYVGRAELKDITTSCFAGIVTFLPVLNHVNAQPNKMFEYMSAGLPVIASDFPLWNEIVVAENAGICVDPISPIEIAKGIQFLLDNPHDASAMSVNGRRAISEKFNWNYEAQKLIDLYEKLI